MGNITISKSSDEVLCVPLDEGLLVNIKKEILGDDYELEIVWVHENTAKDLNVKYRDKDYIPNTLSFRVDDGFGQIFLCNNVLLEQAKKLGFEIGDYVMYILIHSMLHLSGMDHGDDMDKAEKDLTYKYLGIELEDEA